MEDWLSYWTGPKIIIRLTYALEKVGKELTSCGMHIHPAHELIIMKSGHLTVRVSGKSLDLTPNMFLAIPKSVRHDVVFEKGGAVFINVLYRGKMFEVLDTVPMVLKRSERALANDLVLEAKPPIHPVRAELAVARLITLLCRLALQAEAKNSQKRIVPVNRQFYKSLKILIAIEYIEQHFSKPLTLAEVARQAGTSESHLRHLLIQETGCGFSVHLLKARIDHAKKMILETGENIKNIADASGFKSMAFFYKTFKRFTGMTPAVFGKSVPLESSLRAR